MRCQNLKDMNKLGIEILSCNIQNVTDENGLISDLGMDNTAKIKKDAAIATAQADRDVAIAQAEVDKATNDARVLAQTEIAEKNNALAIKQAELKREADTAGTIADAAYQIQEQEQQKTIQAATVNAQIAKAEREAAGIKAKYDAEAAGIAAKGRAEAEAIKAKGLAEAEAMEKKAEAYKKYNGAAMAEMMIKIMPQMAAEIAKPLSQIDKINIYGTGDGAGGASQISGNMPIVMKQVFDTMSEAP